MAHHQITAANETVKAAPAILGTGYTVAGLPLSELAALLTAIYVLLQIVLLVPRYVEWYKSWRLKRVSSKRAPPQS